MGQGGCGGPSFGAQPRGPDAGAALPPAASPSAGACPRSGRSSNWTCTRSLTRLSSASRCGCSLGDMHCMHACMGRMHRMGHVVEGWWPHPASCPAMSASGVQRCGCGRCRSAGPAGLLHSIPAWHPTHPPKRLLKRCGRGRIPHAICRTVHAVRVPRRSGRGQTPTISLWCWLTTSSSTTKSCR